MGLFWTILGALATPFAIGFLAWIVFAAFAAFAPLTLEVFLLRHLTHYDIARDATGVYLRRYYLTPRKWPKRLVKWFPWIKKVKLFLHHILRSDTDANPHDHQWNFWSLILFGRYIEHVYLPNHSCLRYLANEHVDRWDVGCSPDCRYYLRDAPAGTLLRNKAEHTHWIEIKRPVWSLVFVGAKRRSWGFWVYDKATGRDTWVKWHEYLGCRDDESFDPNDV